MRCALSHGALRSVRPRCDSVHERARAGVAMQAATLARLQSTSSTRGGYASSGGSHPESFVLHSRVGSSREGGRSKQDRTYRPKKWQPLTEQQRASAVVRTEAVFGARIIHLAGHHASGGVMDASLLRALRETLESYERNPAVSFVVLRGGVEDVFSVGVDVLALRGRVADPASRAVALEHLRELCALHALVASYTKPISAVMHGTTSGAAFALASNTSFPYVTRDARISVPEVAAGCTPVGGSTYVLSRLRDGVGMYLGLTGAPLRGVDAYWAGVVPHYSRDDGQDTAAALAQAAGEMGSDPRLAADMSVDDVYATSLRVLREHRSDTRLFHVLSNTSEDVSRESFDEYIRLKRWYSHIAAGDKASAAAVLLSPEASLTETGDLFDFHASHALNGREEVPEPAFAAAERRARICALTPHATTVRDGVLDAGPGEGITDALRIIQRCFAGDVTRGDKLLHVAPSAPPGPRTRDTVLARAGKSAAPLADNWETRLPGGVTEAVMAAHERAGSVPVPADLPAMIKAVQAGVARAWPTGAMNDMALDDLCFSAALPDKRPLKDIVSRAVAYATGVLHGLPRHEAWLLEDPALLAREARAAAEEASKLVRRTEDGVELTPRIDADPHGLMYDMHEDEDLFWPIRGTGEAPMDGRELELRTRREDLAPDVALPPSERSSRRAVTSVAGQRRDVMRQLARTALGASAYPAALQVALTHAEERYGVGSTAPANAGVPSISSNAAGRRAKQSKAVAPGTLSPDQAHIQMLELVEAAHSIRREVLLAARDMAAVPPAPDAPAPPPGGEPGVHVRVGATPASAALEFVTEADIDALVRMNLDDPARFEAVQTSLPPLQSATGVPAAAAAAPVPTEPESEHVTRVRRLLRIWAALRRSLREQGDRRPLHGDALPADIAAAAPSTQAAYTASTSGSAGAAAAPARKGANAAGTASGAQPKFVSTVRMAPEAQERLKTALRRFATAEVLLVGHRLHEVLRVGVSAADGNIGAAVDEVYALARSAKDGGVCLRRIVPPAAAGQRSAANKSAGGSPLDTVAPASLPALDAPPLSSSSRTSSGDSGAYDDAYEPPAKWDAAHVRDALTHARYLIASFGLPRTGDTLAAGKKAVSALKAAADAQVAVPHVASVDEIVRRLRADARSSPFAKETLARVEGAPADLTRALHAMIVRASTLSLADCLQMEYRAFVRLATGSINLAQLAPTLATPLEGERDLKLPQRRIVAEQRAARAAEMDAFIARMTVEYERGTGPGMLGDVMRRRFQWFRAPHIGFDGDGAEAPDHSDTAMAERDDELSALLEQSMSDSAVSEAGALRDTLLKRSSSIRRALGEQDAADTGADDDAVVDATPTPPVGKKA